MSRKTNCRMTRSLALAAAITACTAASSLAQADEALAKKHNCAACHQLDKKSVGPSYKEIAAKYKGQDAAAKLAEKVKMGGAGVWGQTPMAPNPSVPDADLNALVAWILKS